MWKRRSLNSTEYGELEDLNIMLQQVFLTDSQDRLMWTENSSGMFSIGSIKWAIFNAIGSTATYVMGWNNWVPKK